MVLVLMLGLLVGGAHATAGDESSGRVPVLVLFHERPTSTDVSALERAGARVERRYEVVPAVAAEVPEGALDGLRANPRVRAVEPDAVVRGLDYRSTHDWGVAHVKADQVHAAGNTGTTAAGTAVRVAVLDSGVSCEHVELAGRCTHGGSYVDYTTSSDDDWGHGTHVGGTIVAQRNLDASGDPLSTGVVGVAPTATVSAYKVLDQNGYGSISQVIAALDDVWNSGTPVAEVVNMSLGWSSGSTTFQETVDRAYSDGMVLVAAAGNGGNCGGKGNSVSYPAKYASVIAVAAVDSSDARPCWSSTGQEVELSAPGVSVFSTWPEDLTTSPRDPQPVCDGGTCHYKYGSGTSMAVPHVVGAAALVLAGAGLSDTSGANGLADEVRQRLRETAVDLGSAGHDGQYGHGLVDALAASSGSGSGDSGGGDGGTVGWELQATGRKVKGSQLVDLTWNNAASSDTSVVVHRDGATIAETANDGAYTDSIGAKGGGTYTYQLCGSGGNCSQTVTVSF
ncbi:MAG: S8 family serine peptidase [Actinomycetota bacterium]|nr:S8 family serine peptidase [Actinomycetota bacterium]